MSLSISEKILLAKYMYKQGVDYISDQDYDALVKQLPPNHISLYQRWDEVTFEEVEPLLVRENIDLNRMLKSAGIQKSENTEKQDETEKPEYSLIDILNQDADKISPQDLMSRFPSPSSMQMTTDYDVIYNSYMPQIMNLANGNPVTMLQSYKMDGWNITCYYKTGTDGGVMLAHTRGRTTSDVTICTELMRYLTPNLKEVLNSYRYPTILRITGELVLRHDGLPILRQAYPDKSFSNVRNSVSAFVHGSIDIAKYHNLVSYYAFSFYDLSSGGCPFKYAYDMYTWLSRAGFNTPPGNKIVIASPTTMRQTMDAYYESFENYYVNELSKYFECDGLVLQPDDLSWNDQIQQVVQGSFGDGLIAIKARYWAEKVYRAVVDEIIYPKARASRSVMAIVKPVTTALGQVVRRVPLINLQRACIENDVHVGDTIEFIYHSNQLPFFTRNISNLERKGERVDI